MKILKYCLCVTSILGVLFVIILWRYTDYLKNYSVEDSKPDHISVEIPTQSEFIREDISLEEIELPFEYYTILGEEYPNTASYLIIDETSDLTSTDIENILKLRKLETVRLRGDFSVIDISFLSELPELLTLGFTVDTRGTPLPSSDILKQFITVEVVDFYLSFDSSA